MTSYQEIFSELFTLRTVAKEILACAIFYEYEEAKLLGGELTRDGFYYDFFFPYEISKEILEQIELKMRSICKQDLLIEQSEMVVASAEGYLDHIGLGYRKSDLKNKMAVSFFKMGDFIDLCKPPYLKTSSDVRYFSLVDFKKIDAKRLRIFGTAFLEKKQLKKYLSSLVRYPKKNHLTIGEKLKLFAQEPFVYLPNGIKFLETLVNRYKEIAKEEDYIFIKSSNKSFEHHLSVFKAEGFQKISEVFYTSDHQPENTTLFDITLTGTKETYFCDKASLENACISCLQFILKIINIFNLKLYPVLILSARKRAKEEKNRQSLLKQALDTLGFDYDLIEKPMEGNSARVEFYSEDGLKRKWKISELEIVDQKQEVEVIQMRSLLSMERFIALELENTQGNLPFEVMPWQVKVFPMKREDTSYSKKVAFLCEKLGYSVSVDDRFEKSLSERVYQAELEKWQYLLFAGPKERKTASITFRIRGKNREVKLDQLERKYFENQ